MNRRALGHWLFVEKRHIVGCSMSAMEADDAVGSSQYAQRPDGTRRLRACKRCKLIKTEDQFVQYACDNCPRPEKGAKAYRQEWTDSHTTPDFEGWV